jgi:hypothetical protein
MAKPLLWRSYVVETGHVKSEIISRNIEAKQKMQRHFTAAHECASHIANMPDHATICSEAPLTLYEGGCYVRKIAGAVY